jgi:adenylate kinase
MADVCDVCGGRLVARTDDTAEAVRPGLRDHHAKTRPSSAAASAWAR